jgi:beta-aspartyl-peptidase (threonine type)
MKSFLAILALIFAFNTVNAQLDTMPARPHDFAIALHGGASNIRNMSLTPKQDSAYRKALSDAVDIGYAILKKGGKAIDAVTATVVFLEDNPLFNAGKGSVFTADTTIEMDAAVMGGKTLKCGAVSGVHTIKNPILAARKILDSSQFVMLSGAGAEKFAKEQGLEIVDPEYFKTDFRLQQFLKLKNTDTTHLDNDSKGEIEPLDDLRFDKFGTVGCVAIDVRGNMAAATSTGGVVNKKYNRIGDSPIIGAGTYANNKTCAVSCTGKGEDFIRLVAAHDISALIEYKNLTLRRAVNLVIKKKLVEKKGRGGCIAVDKHSNIQMVFTTSGMFRASVDKRGKKKVAIYDTE